MWSSVGRISIVVAYLKTDFHSTEYKRTFDKVYLISQLVPSDHGGAGGGMGMPNSSVTQDPP